MRTTRPVHRPKAGALTRFFADPPPFVLRDFVAPCEAVTPSPSVASGCESHPREEMKRRRMPVRFFEVIGNQPCACYSMIVRMSCGIGASSVIVCRVAGCGRLTFHAWSACRPIAPSVAPYICSPTSGQPREAR